MEKKRTRTQTRIASVPAPAEVPLSAEAPLSARLAFVVQFRRGAGQQPGTFAGRVEHMATYEAARFATMAELMAFLRRVLHTEQSPPPHDP